MNIYLELTRQFNEGRLRCAISSGQAVVLHRLAIMSKDGDWIMREDEEAARHVLSVLDRHGARYRFGAPLDVRWLAGGWSSHFEFHHGDLRVRTDFVSRPPQLSDNDLAAMWADLDRRHPEVPVIDARRLAELKKTNREKDYVVIGELARFMTDPRDRFLYSRSAQDLAQLAQQYPDTLEGLIALRPLLAVIPQGRDALETALDAERRSLIHANERRLETYEHATGAWNQEWRRIEDQTREMTLPAAHALIVERAHHILPTKP